MARILGFHPRDAGSSPARGIFSSLVQRQHTGTIYSPEMQVRILQELTVQHDAKLCQSYSVVVSTSVVPTENGGSIPPRTCGRDAGHRLSHKRKPLVVKTMQGR